MSYSVEKMEGEPIILITFHADFDVQNESKPLLDACVKLFNEQHEAVDTIWDVLELKVDLQSVLSAAQMDFKDIMPDHMRSIVAVVPAGSDDLYRFFGHYLVPARETHDMAMARIMSERDTSRLLEPPNIEWRPPNE